MSENDSGWYYVDKRGDRQGPISREELVALRQADVVTGYTQVWTSTLSDWQSYRVAFNEPATTVALGPGLDTTAHPWRRYFAKMIDVWVMGLPPLFIIALIIAVIAPEASEGFERLVDNSFVALIVVFGCWLFWEALLLSLFGSTPGRLLLGLKVRDARSGARLSFGTALTRGVLVLVQGMAVGVPIIALVTHICAYNRLTSTNTTLWDASSDSIVGAQPFGALRTALVTVIVASLMILMLVGVVVGARG